MMTVLPSRVDGREAVPYLSVVATSRNDDHGGDLTGRMQLFVRALASQAMRHGIPSELVLVEWNPPENRPRLADVLTWPDDQGWCPIRIITVPPAVHRRFAHSDRMPLFQMIGKNVGIRRAHGAFVLATNVDILFSDPLIAFLAQRGLRPDCLYRSDRIDVNRGVPVHEGIDLQLAYCRTHVLRANRPDGIWLVPPGGMPHTVEEATLSVEDVLGRNASGRVGLPLGRRVRRSLERTPVGRAVSDSRLWRLFRTGWRVLQVAQRAGRHARQGCRYLVARARAQGEPLPASLSFREVVDDVMLPLRRPDLHVLACGDFTLLAKETWFRIGGNPELEMFSLHLDSLTVYGAYALGVAEVRLSPDMVHYHIEHEGGWTLEQEQVLYERIRGLGIPIMTQGTLARLARRLRRGAKLSFSGPEWGLANHVLPETRLAGGRVIEKSPAPAVTS